jgi:very-short-patch-repair endonuclease
VTPDQRLASLARGQLSLFTTAQAEACGIDRTTLARRGLEGRVEPVRYGVWSMPGVAPSADRALLAAWLAAGPDAVVSGRAAARLLGFDGFRRDLVELTVRRGRRARLPGVIMHTTSTLPALDVITFPPFRVTSGARTIIDLAAVASEREVIAAIGSARRDGLTSETYLRARLAALRGPGRAGVRLLDRALDGPIAHSFLERAFLRLVAAGGLARPRTQVVFRGERVMRVDARWEAERVVVEVMGHRWHCTKDDLQRDAQRRNELQSLGELVLEFTADDIVRHPGQVLSRLGATLRARSRDGMLRLAQQSVT